MQRIALLITLILSANQAIANIPTYYPEKFHKTLFEGESSDEEIREALFKTLHMAHLKGDSYDQLANSCFTGKNCAWHKTDDYREARVHLFGFLHLDQDNDGKDFIQGAYCSKIFSKRTPRIGNLGKGRIPNHEILNAEHVWPQSRFTSRFPKKLQKSDLHHLFPTDNRANGTRGNLPFGNIPERNRREVSNCDGPFFGQVSGQGPSFEPPTRSKGNIARAIFYVAARYKRTIAPTQEKALREWHELDPVDEFETWRNNKVEEIQGNRNPFIDFPQLVNSISDF